MFVLRDKSTKLYVRKHFSWKEKTNLTGKLQKARIFPRLSDAKQSGPWTGGVGWNPETRRYFNKFTDETRPVELVEVRLFQVED